jgi:hypothetical protein
MRAIGFELGFAGPLVPMPPPSRDSARRPDSRGSRYLQLRQLDLQLAFARARAARRCRE